MSHKNENWPESYNQLTFSESVDTSLHDMLPEYEELEDHLFHVAQFETSFAFLQQLNSIKIIDFNSKNLEYEIHRKVKTEDGQFRIDKTNRRLINQPRTMQRVVLQS